MHVPVLLKEVLELFDPQPNQYFIDCTIGEGGHAKAILERTAPGGLLLGIDRDAQILERARATLRPFEKRIILVHDTYASLQEICRTRQFPKAHGILFDLGISSWHLEASGGGFSFQRDEPLDMRFDRTAPAPSAREIIYQWPQERLERILTEFGEERYAARIARAIVAARAAQPIATTRELAEVVARGIGMRRSPARHPATRTFQALRIVVNQEIAMLERALPQAFTQLERSGTLLAISYHSLEDRAVKQFIRSMQQESLGMPVAKKPIIPSREEIRVNPRARSAKLRGIRRS